MDSNMNAYIVQKNLHSQKSWRIEFKNIKYNFGSLSYIWKAHNILLCLKMVR